MTAKRERKARDKSPAAKDKKPAERDPARHALSKLDAIETSPGSLLAASSLAPPARSVEDLTARQRRQLGIARPRGRPLKADARLLQIKAAVTADEKVAVLALASALGHVSAEGEPMEGALVRALVVTPALEHQARAADREAQSRP